MIGRHAPARRFGQFVVLLGLPLALVLLGLPSVAQGDPAGGGPNQHANANATSQEPPGQQKKSAAPTNSPQPLSNADENGSGANPGTTAGCGSYCSTRDGSASGNGNGGGQAVGKPCAGCVGKADNKNPPGQAPSGADANAGYECDRNHGIGRTNPAHTGCLTAPPTASPAPSPTPSATPSETPGPTPSATPSETTSPTASPTPGEFTGGGGGITGGGGGLTGGGGGLPFTGDATALLALMALAMLGGGTSLVVLARRR